MTDSLVLVEKSKGVALLTLNRPDALNALSFALRAEIVKIFESLKDDDEIGAIVLTGAGRAFSAGVDLKELSSAEGDNKKAVLGGNVQKAILKVGKPVIAAVNGFVITGGFELALLSDFMIASTKAKFSDTHAQVGIVPGWGMSQRLPRLIGMNRAKELSFTGRFLDAETAEKWGLVNRVVKAEELIPICLTMAEDIAGAEQKTLKTVKRIMDEGDATTLAEGLRIESKAAAQHMKEVTPAFLETRRLLVMERGRKKKNEE